MQVPLVPFVSNSPRRTCIRPRSAARQGARNNPCSPAAPCPLPRVLSPYSSVTLSLSPRRSGE
jgi:hypothetical protein